MDSTVTPMEVQEKDESSMLNYYKSLINLRNHSSALTYGELTPIDMSANTSICAFSRSDDKESLLVIHNLAGEKQVLNIPSNLSDFNNIYFASKKAKATAAQVEIPEYSTVILKK